MKMHLELDAPAKINLTLKIIGKRTDGYHELESIMQQISLHDKLFLDAAGIGIKVTSNSGQIPDNEENLAFRAADLMYSKFSLPLGIKIYIEKNIPVGAGLAGGSTDAAAVIRGINELFGLGLPLEQMYKLGLEIGSDVPFCLLGGAALARGRGEILEPLPAGPPMEMVLVKPEYQLSTREVYRDFRMERVQDAPDNAAFLEAWRQYDMIGLVSEMKNVLETVSIDKCPEIQSIKDKMAVLGAKRTLMSGSGPSVFGVFACKDEALNVWEIIKDQYRESYLVSSCDRGD